MRICIDGVKCHYAGSHLAAPAPTRENMHVGKQRHFVREWRKAKGWSQVELAERAQVTQSMVSRVESGKQPYDADFLEQVALAMNVTPADLIMRDPSDPEGLWSIHDQLKPVERVQLVEVAKALKRAAS